MANIKTTLHNYRFDTSNSDEEAAYLDLLKGTLEKIGFPVWTMDLRHGYTANEEGWKFMDKIRAAAGIVEIDTAHLFSNQWNSAPVHGVSDSGLRLFNWAECKYANEYIREGYWLEQTPEMSEILRNTQKCGYCGKQEPAQNGYVFCPHCIASEYLDEKSLYLTRMMPVDSDDKKRAPLSNAEREYLLPIWKEAQLHGNAKRSLKLQAEKRAILEADYRKAIYKAETEFKGLTWLMDHGISTENCIYYAHKDRFSFGWRNPVEAELVSALLDVISEFPFRYEIKCADGRNLSN